MRLATLNPNSNSVVQIPASRKEQFINPNNYRLTYRDKDALRIQRACFHRRHSHCDYGAHKY